MPLEPTRYVRAPLATPAGNWPTRAFKALVVERRLPYRVSVALDKLCNAIGIRRKTAKTNGLRVRVRRLTCDESIVRHVLEDHEYTPAGFEIHESDVVIDIGGNIGAFALLAAKHARRGIVFTFEPNSENYELLLQNIALNKIRNVVAVRAAVAGGKGKVKLFCSPQGGFHSLLEERRSDPNRYEMVDAIGLKDIFDEHNIERCNFLKLDCEGAEYDILYHLPPEYFSRIDKIAMEYHGESNPGKRRAQADALVSHLQSAGFDIEAYEEAIGFRGGFIRAARHRS